jgi:hypothetical protein
VICVGMVPYWSIACVIFFCIHRLTGLVESGAELWDTFILQYISTQLTK